MLRMLRYVLSTPLLLSFAGTAAFTQTSGKDIPPTIIAMERAALDRSDKGDCDGFLEITDPEVVYMDPFLDKPIYGLEALRTYYHGFPPYPPISGKMVNAKVQVVGEDAAVLTFNYVGKGLPRLGWNCTEVYRRTKDGWRIVQTHWSYVKAQPAS